MLYPYSHTHTHTHTHIAYVSESGNQIDDAGAQVLADAIKELKGLKDLYLHSEYVIGCVSV